jgi:hypothetical protein
MSFLKRRRDDDFEMLIEEEDSSPRKPLLSPELQVAIAFGLTLVAGLICVVALYPRLRADQSQGGQEQSDLTIPTAREAYNAAHAMITEIDPAAQLADAVGLWSPVIDPVQFRAGRTSWTFHYYLPSTGEMAVVVVGRDNETRVASRVPWETPPDVISPGGWRIDSPEVAVQLDSLCAETLRAAPESTLELRLSTAVENRSLLWQAHLLSDDPLVVCEVLIDATTGLMR